MQGRLTALTVWFFFVGMQWSIAQDSQASIPPERTQSSETKLVLSETEVITASADSSVQIKMLVAPQPDLKAEQISLQKRKSDIQKIPVKTASYVEMIRKRETSHKQFILNETARAAHRRNRMEYRKQKGISLLRPAMIAGHDINAPPVFYWDYLGHWQMSGPLR